MLTRTQSPMSGFPQFNHTWLWLHVREAVNESVEERKTNALKQANSFTYLRLEKFRVFTSAPKLGTQRVCPTQQMPSPPCPHGRQRYHCKECGGGGICEHGRQRSRCKDCGGGGICEHGRARRRCKDCGGSSICEHGRRRSGCKECGGSRQDAVILEATVVEGDEDAEPDEWIPIVPSGKRKR